MLYTLFNIKYTMKQIVMQLYFDDISRYHYLLVLIIVDFN